MVTVVAPAGAVRIIIPRRRYHNDKVTKLIERLANICGGLSVHHVEGMWLNDQGSMELELCCVVYAHVYGISMVAANRCVMDIAEHLLFLGEREVLTHLGMVSK